MKIKNGKLEREQRRNSKRMEVKENTKLKRKHLSMTETYNMNIACIYLLKIEMSLCYG